MSDRFQARLPLLGLAAILLGVFLALFAVDRVSGDRESDALRRERGGVASGSLTPRVHRFGDLVHAHIRVVVDRSVQDPERVRLDASFRPYDRLGEPRVQRRDVGRLTELRYTIALRCLKASCLPERGDASREFRFSPAAVLLRRPRDVGSQVDFVDVHWPPVTVVSHLSREHLESVSRALELGGLDAALGLGAGERARIWRADPLNLPPPSYRVSPTLLSSLLLAFSILLALGAAALVWMQIRRPVAPAPIERPAVELTPLERALGLLDSTLSNGDVGEQRKVLELLARELTNHGVGDLARDARALAWSEGSPPRDRVRTLAQRVRTALAGRSAGGPG